MLHQWVIYFPQMMQGVLVTLELTGLSLVVALVFGFILALMRLSRSKILNFIGTWYIEIVRAVPVLVIIFVVYYSLGNVIQLQDIAAAVISLGAFYATQYAEIFRGAILGVDRGQTEAASALGLTGTTIMRKIILPQAFFNILPPATNQLSNLIKDTSLVFTIGISDLMLQAKSAVADNFLPLDDLLEAGVIYFIFYLILSKLLARWELNVQRSRS